MSATLKTSPTAGNKLSKLDVLNKVIEYYGENPKLKRSVKANQHGENQCVYKGDNNTVCAFALFVKPEKRRYLIENKTVQNMFGFGGEYLGVETVSDFLKKEAMHITDLDFWQAIQYLHDDNLCWSTKGLTARGYSYVNRIKRDFNL